MIPSFQRFMRHRVFLTAAGKRRRNGLCLLRVVYEVFEPSAGKLADKKSSDEQGEAAQLPPDAQEVPKGDNNGDGNVDRQKPLNGKPANTRSPIPERDIDNKNQQCDSQ